MSGKQRRSERAESGLEGFFFFRNKKGEGIGRKALVRDMSRHGVYLISDIRPDLGCESELLVSRLEKGSMKARLLDLRGKIVRIENLSTGTYGIAVDFESSLAD